MSTPHVDIDDELAARVAWSRLIEPGDAVAGELVRTLGAVRALAWARAAATSRDVAALVAGLVHAEPALDDIRRRLGIAVGRWAGRITDLDPARDLERVDRLGG